MLKETFTSILVFPSILIFELGAYARKRKERQEAIPVVRLIRTHYYLLLGIIIIIRSSLLGQWHASALVLFISVFNSAVV